MQRRWTRTWAAIVAAALAIAPLPALAGPASEVLVEAKRLYQEGKAKYDTVDYEGAIDAWTRAYGMLPEDEIEVRSALAYNLAAAREKRYELNGDVVELKRARILLIKYVDETKSIMEPGEKLDEMISTADERIAKIDRLLGEQSEPAKPEPTPEPETAEPEPEPEPEGPVEGPADEVPPEGKGGKPLLYAGIGTAAAGVAAFGVSAAFMARGASKNQEVTDASDDEAARMTAIDQGKSANTLAVALGATAGVLLTGGAVLIALGVKKNKQAKNASVVPSVGPGQAGVVFMGRF